MFDDVAVLLMVGFSFSFFFLRGLFVDSAFVVLPSEVVGLVVVGEGLGETLKEEGKVAPAGLTPLGNCLICFTGEDGVEIDNAVAAVAAVVGPLVGAPP